jgi:dipeptide/tripeptide permease
VMMGVWFLSIAFGNKVAGYAAGFFSSMPLQQLFINVAAALLITAAVMFILVKPTKRLMSGVH